ncbi:G-protein coupled receptor, partial [Elysia marginata]
MPKARTPCRPPARDWVTTLLTEPVLATTADVAAARSPLTCGPSVTSSHFMVRVRGISSLWSEYYVRDGRIVKETSASPAQPLSSIIELFDRREPFFAQDGYCIQYKLCGSDQQVGSGDGAFPCVAPYLMEFAPCDQKLHFLCEIPARTLQNLERQGDDFFNIDDQLDFNLKFSAGAAAFSDAGQVCSREAPGGTPFRLASPADDAVLKVTVGGIIANLNVINVSESELSRTLFWLDNSARPGCYAFSITELDTGFTTEPTVLQSWPCDAQLRVLCQFKKSQEEQELPVMRAEIRSNLIRQIGNDILAHSEVIRQVGGLIPLTTGGDQDQDAPVSGSSLRMSCDVPFLTTHQSASLYKNGVIQARREGNRFYEVRDLRYDFSLRLSESFPGQYNILDSVASYSCDYNQADSTSVLNSNYLFVRPTDVELYSAHFRLNRTKAVLPWPDALLSSLLDNWASQLVPNIVGPDGLEETGGSLARPQRQTASTGLFLSSVSGTLTPTGFGLTPLELRDLGPDKDAVFIMYVYKKTPQSNPLVFTDISSDDTSLKQLQAGVAALFDQLKPLGINSVDVVSIDYCWATTRQDDVTGNTYQLPTTRAPALWTSDQTCARDNGPLVTVECMGDKRSGFQWGPTMVNPLCNYSDEKDEDSPITDRLRDLAQAPVTPNNTDATVEDLKTLVESVDPNVVSPTDVVLVADVLQKVTTTGGPLDQDAVQDILSTVDAVSRLPQETLAGGQSRGQASNRILEAADRLGAVAQVPASDTRQRVVSGGVGFELWQLEDVAPDSNIIVGIKMLSDGSKEMVTYQELVSQYSDRSVEYAGTEAAIYLPEQLLRSYVDNRNGSEIRLAMNVYKVTSLYRDPGSGQDTGVNRTLNSRVIAAQLLVDGQPITELDGYKVLTVFQPTSVVLPTEERPNRTTCVYWNFTANQNAGGWSSDGCRYGRTREGRDVCECDHLTNFAVLVSFYDQSELEHKEILGYITIVGLSLSIAGLALSMLSFIFIKKLRQGRPQQTLFQLSLALLLSWVVFLAGIERTSNHDGCIAVAAILHYLILASFMWMLMEALLQYLLFVRVMNSYFTNYMWKTSIPSWGLPIIPVIIILAIDTELYKGGDDYCWMDVDAFYYGFAIPVGLIILTNLVVFVLVTVSLWRRKDMSKHSTQKSNHTLVNIRASFICFCVL